MLPVEAKLTNAMMIGTHPVNMRHLRTIIGNLGERNFVAIEREGDVANCAITQ